jgi:transcription elongation factor Elf1
MQEEVVATCPHCGEEISLLIDLSVDEQSYAEDCSVCCRPMLINYKVEEGELADISVDAE